ncbi:acetylornithine deacetylase [Microvirga thermotolerans]|uniref:Acetylornithine deacetylase n=1 Tax=Microvirga thermotolerans TaxID=2651334 RepID=A0A5P9JRX5_9HYPH|nr:acetylornithine deacetylase [Microvirga thermotolerans]QFU15522.1 acetylornithine deacetylase [Microvirga thermotolerans]
MSPKGQRLTPLEMLAKLVSFDTESSKSNLPLIEFVEDYLRSWDVPFVRVPNAAGDKAALYATVGPSDRSGIVLSGHTDVVPVTGQAWTSDPFALRVENGRAYGRGAVDMKAFDALALALVPDFLAANLKTPINIMLSYDEETTCLGVVDTIRRMGRELPLPKAAIIGEPTSMEVVDAHKSVVTFVTTVHGFEAHSSKPYLGASAVMAAAELICELNRIADEMMERGDPSGRFDPPYTTVHVGVVAGGTARNIMAKTCTFHWEFRGLPSLDPREIPDRLDRFAREVVLERMNRFGEFGRIETQLEVAVPGLAPDPGSPAESLALRLVGKNRTQTVPFGTEAGHFQAAGIPTVVCGPGSIDQAHQPDEYITLEQLAAGEAFMRRLAAACAEA